MSVEALPYTLLLLLGQFAAGTAAVLVGLQARGRFEPGYLRVCAWFVVAGAALLTLTALALDAKAAIDGYAIESRVLGALRATAVAMLLFSAAHVFFLRRPDEAFLALSTGATTAGLGVVALVLMAQMVHGPTWSVAGPLLVLLAGALTLGSVTLAMVWGHWYLVNPRLPEGPLVDVTLLVIAALLIETAVVVLNAAVPAGTPLQSDALLAIDLPENPAFWLRVGVGLLFPAVLAFMALQSSLERAMMSATGLLYIAVGAVLAGEALGRGLLFVTGAPV